MGMYEAKEIVMLSIMLQGVMEDLRLSEERMTAFSSINDMETLEIEKMINADYVKRKEMIESLISDYKNCSSSFMTVVQIGHFNDDQTDLKIEEEWVADPIQELY